MTRKGDRWSKRETRKLKNKWPDSTAEEIAGMLPGRTVEAVESKAQRLNEKGELPEKNRSTSSQSSYSTSEKQVEKGGSQIQQVSGKVQGARKIAPSSMDRDSSNTIRLRIDGEDYYTTYSPSKFEETKYGFAFDRGDSYVTVDEAYLQGADYSIKKSGSREYKWLHSLGTIQTNGAITVPKNEEKGQPIKHVKLKEEDLKEAWRYKHKSESYKGRTSVVLQVWEDQEYANVHYHQEGNRYPKGGGPMGGLPIRKIVDSTTDWPVRDIEKRNVKEMYDQFQGRDMDDLYDDEEFQEKVDEWMEEAKEMFWSEAQYNEGPFSLGRGNGPKAKVEVVKG